MLNLDGGMLKSQWGKAKSRSETLALDGGMCTPQNLCTSYYDRGSHSLCDLNVGDFVCLKPVNSKQL